MVIVFCNGSRSSAQKSDCQIKRFTTPLPPHSLAFANRWHVLMCASVRILLHRIIHGFEWQFGYGQLLRCCGWFAQRGHRQNATVTSRMIMSYDCGLMLLPRRRRLNSANLIELSRTFASTTFHKSRTTNTWAPKSSSTEWPRWVVDKFW